MRAPLGSTLDVMKRFGPIVWFLFLHVTLFPGTVKGDEPVYMHVGEIPAKCPITISATTPKGFRVSPQRAAELASKRATVKCNSIFEQSVYADSENYYIIKSAFGSMNKDADAVVVNGRTGRVSALK